MICAECLRSVYGTPRRTRFCSRGILTVSSRCIMRTMAGLSALHHRSKRCWPVERSLENQSPLVGLDFVSSAAFPNPLPHTRKSVPCRRVRRFGWIASALTRHKQYFSIAGTYCRAEAATSRRKDEDQQLAAREALLDSVRHHLVADVPVGAFLSSGIDSGALVGLMRDAGQQDIQTVTLAFEEFRGTSEDEAPIAAEIASQYGTRHTTRIVTEQEFRDDLPKILEAMDQPTIDGLNTWFVSKAARELGLKSGDFRLGWG